MKRHSGVIVGNSSKRMRVHENLSINDIPKEVMIGIFKLFSSSERLAMITVSDKWMEILSDHFSKDSSITLTKDMSFSDFFNTFSCRPLAIQQKRAFKHLTIESFPEELEALHTFSRCIDCIISGVKFFKVDASPNTNMPVNYLNELYYAKMPNLRTLDVADAVFLGDLRYLNNLKEIKIHREVTNLKLITMIRDKEISKSLKCTNLVLPSYFFESIVPYMNKRLMNFFKQMLGKNLYGQVTIKSNYNFCGKYKMTPSDIIELTFTNGISSTVPLKHFRNLKKIEFVDFGPILPLFEAKLSGVTHLKMSNTDSLNYVTNRLSQMLVAFPNLESLEIDGLALQEKAFSQICQYLPKLQELKLLNGNKHNKISIEFFLSSTTYSLKNLANLQKLVVETSHYDYPNNSVDSVYEWPPLPYLTELSLDGNCFRYFTVHHFAQMANNSPKIEKFDLKFDQNVQNLALLPLVFKWGENLTHFSVPGEGNEFDQNDDEPNVTLVSDIIEQCPNLEALSIHDNIGLSLSQEVELFREILSLESVTSVIYNEYEHYTLTRNMSRENFNNMKLYLSKNLAYYTSTTETIEYIMDNEVSPNERLQFYRSFEAKYPDESDDVKNMYSVTKGYLNMEHIDLCRLLVNLD